MDTVKKLRFLLILIILVAIGVGALWLLVPVPSGVEKAVFYSPIGTPVTLADLTIALGGSLLFLRALHNFKQELKPAYRLIAYAQLAVGLCTMLFPYIEYYDLWGNVWFNMSSYLAYLSGSILMYFGTRRFYKILQMRSRVTSARLVGGIVLALWIIHAFLPHAEWVGLNDHQYDVFELAVIIPVIGYGAAAYMAFKIRQKTGNEYRKSFGWLTLGLSLQLLSSISILVLDVTGYDNWYFNSRFYEIPTIAGDLGLLFAAFYFNAVGLSYTPRGLWRRLLGDTPKVTTSLDIITYTANMTSDPVKIDPYLDKMREITAQMQPGKALDSKDQQILRNVYLDIEQYLTTSDPLRTYDKNTLRAGIAKHFALDSTQSTTFWPTIPASN